MPKRASHLRTRIKRDLLRGALWCTDDTRTSKATHRRKVSLWPLVLHNEKRSPRDGCWAFLTLFDIILGIRKSLDPELVGFPVSLFCLEALLGNSSGFRAFSPVLKVQVYMGRAALVGHMLSAALHFWTCARMKRVEPVKHIPAGVSGPSTPGMDGGQLSDQFHVLSGHCWVNRALPGGPGQSHFAVLLQGIWVTQVMTKPTGAANYKHSD